MHFFTFLPNKLLQWGGQRYWAFPFSRLPCCHTSTIENLIYFFTKQASSIKRSTVLSLPSQLGFPAVSHKHYWKHYLLHYKTSYFSKEVNGIEPSLSLRLPCCISQDLCSTREYKRWKYHCTVDILFDWFGLVCFANKNKNCQLSYSWFQTS